MLCVIVALGSRTEARNRVSEKEEILKKKIPRIRRTPAALCVLILLVMLFSITASALDMYVLSGYHLTGGITSVSFHYTNPNGYSNDHNINYLSSILLVANAWSSNVRTYTGRVISVTYSTSTSIADINYEFINSSTSPYDTNLAGCVSYNANGTLTPTAGDSDLYPSPAGNYAYAKILLNQANTKSISETFDFELLVAHEKGHVFGPCHMSPINDSSWNSQPDCQSILYEHTRSIYSDHQIHRPTATDCKGAAAANRN